MPWLRATLRGKEVYARADAAGRFVSEGGRVEIRYNPRDGRLYRAAARNLEVLDPAVLPDETCAEAEAVESGKGQSGKSGKKVKASSAKDGPSSPPREGELVAYTDGACSGNPGPAGLGVVLILDESQRVERFEYLGTGTNNIAELTAILRAVEEIDEDTPAVVYTDSRYSIGVLQKGWKAKKNKELIAATREALARHGRVRLEYVPGHAGVPLNERADELARRAIEQRSSKRRLLKKV